MSGFLDPCVEPEKEGGAAHRMSLDAAGVVQTLLRDRVRLTAVAASILRDAHDADDVFQQVVLAALRATELFREPEHLLAWALRATRHRAIDAARRRRVHILDEGALDALESHWASLSEDDAPDRVEALRRCLAGLPDAAREVLRLRYEQGLGCPDIAARLRRTVDAVYQTLSRLHKRLRECIESRLGESGPTTEGRIP